MTIFGDVAIIIFRDLVTVFGKSVTLFRKVSHYLLGISRNFGHYGGWGFKYSEISPVLLGIP